jgi:hypothetical protein
MLVKNYSRLFAVVTALFVAITVNAAVPVPPTSLKLLAPDYENYPLYVGEIRAIEPLFFNQGHDDLDSNYQAVTQRGLLWSVMAADNASTSGLTVSPYGVVTAIAPGTYTVRVTSLAKPSLSATKVITVIAAPEEAPIPSEHAPRLGDQIPSYPAFNTLQKIVTHHATATCQYDAQSASSTVTQGNIVWQVTPFADATQNNQYVLLTNNNTNVYGRDQQQYLISNRYLPTDGRYLPTDGKGLSSNLKLQHSGTSGICIFLLNSDGSSVVDSTQVLLQNMTAEQKADYLTTQTTQNVLRRGYASGANLTGNKWVPEVSDNDGLWTSMYGAGQLFRYAVLKQEGSSETEQARQEALASLKAVLLLSNIPGRTQNVDANIRYLSNYLIRGSYNRYSNEFLKAGTVYSIDNYAGSLADQLGYYGMDAFATFPYGSRKTKFTLTPCFSGFTPDECANSLLNWTADTKVTPATRQRYLPGFVARTNVISGVESYDAGDGLFIKRGAEGTVEQQVLSGADRLYFDAKTPVPFAINVGNTPLPDILRDVINVDGHQYQSSDVIYKADTSLDEIIGHLFIYKVAFDILDNNNEEEATLKQLITNTVVALAEHYASNAYSLTDATGQPPSWGNSTRDYFTMDAELGDGPTAMIPILVFKEAYYMTGDVRWQNEYQFLATNPSWNLLGIINNYTKRILWMNENIDIDPAPPTPIMHLNATKNPSMSEQIRHAQYWLNYSDQNMQMLAYYLALEMEDDPQYQKIYANGLSNLWQFVSYTENPLWYFIYQLANPRDDSIKDAYGHPILETAAWSLSRYPTDSIQYQAYIKGSRADVLDDNSLTINPALPALVFRTSEHDAKNADVPLNKQLYPNYNSQKIYPLLVLPPDERALEKYNGVGYQGPDIDNNPSYMQPSTMYSLPYWFGRYYGILTTG